MFNAINFSTLFTLLIGAFLGWVVGYFVENNIFRSLTRVTKLTEWHLDTILFNAWRGVLVWVGLVLGMYVATNYVNSSLQTSVAFKNITVFVLILLVTWGFARMLAGLLSFWFKMAKGTTQTTTMLTATSFILIFTIGSLVALQTIGVAIAPIIAALGVGGLAVALAIRPVLEDIFAGLQLLLSDTIKPGDYVEIEADHKGKVVDISWRTTTLDSFGSSEKIIPNSKLVKSIVINFNRPTKQYNVKVLLEVPYESDLEKIEQILITEAQAIIKKHEVAIQDIDPVVLFKELNDSSVSVQMIIKIRQYTDQYVFEHELIKHIQKRFKKKHIKILFQ